MDEKDVVETAFAMPVPLIPLIPDVGPPPDGGREAWCCAISGGFVTFCLMGFGGLLARVD